MSHRDYSKQPITKKEMRDAVENALRNRQRGALSVGDHGVEALRQVLELVDQHG